MKTSVTKHFAFAAILLLGFTACKKDKKDDSPTPPAQVSSITITDLKALSTSATVTVPDLKKITGYVISDLSGKNIDSKTVILQEDDNKPGIVVTFDGAQTFAAGDQVQVVVSKQTLVQLNGEVVLQNVPKANATKTGQTKTITPRTATLSNVITNAAAWDGTLVTVPVGYFSGGGGKFTGTLSFTDNTVNVKSQILSGAAFENSTYPAAVNSLTGIVRINGSDIRIDLRSSGDAVSKAGYFYVEDFSGADVGYFASNDNGIGGSYQSYPAQFSTNLLTKYPDLQNYLWGPGNYGIFKVGQVASGSADAGFCTPGKNYVSIIPVQSNSTDPTEVKNNNGAGFYLPIDIDGNAGVSTSVLQNLKSITVVMAGSKTGVSDYQDIVTSGKISNLQFNAFNAGTDGCVTGIGTVTTVTLNTFDYNIFSKQQFNDQGVWHTIVLDPTIIQGKIPGDLSKLVFRAPSENYSRGTFVSNGQTFKFSTPVIIDKIILEFSAKPAWDK